MFGVGGLKKRIADLEARCEWLSAELTAARKPAEDCRNRILNEERLRHEAERLRGEAERRQREAERQLAERDSLLRRQEAELLRLRAEASRIETLLKWERRKVRRLEAQLNVRKGKEDYFGLATPSSLKLNKPKATPENQAKKGGAWKGHPGHGRTGFTREDADEVVTLDTPPSTPCGCDAPGWDAGKTVSHCVVELIPARTVERYYQKTVFTCPNCGRKTTPPTPGVIPGGLYGNSLFRHHADCCFQWVKSPDIPAENNFAERILRPVAIARKISFGSQSANGMKTREVLMSFLHTARLRGRDPCRTLEEALNLLSLDPKTNILPLLGF